MGAAICACLNGVRHPLMARAKSTRTLDVHRLPSGITAQQEAYCRGRAMGMDAREAHAAMGGTCLLSTAKTWERNNQGVRSRIEALSEMASKNAILKTGLDREWVITRLMSVVDRCMVAEPVMVKGKPSGEFQFDASGANQALRMLGDTLGLFKPAEVKPGDEYANLSDDDITRITAELAAQTGLIEFAQGAKAPPGPQPVVDVQAVPKADRVS